MCWVVHIFILDWQNIVYSSACVGSTSYFVVYAEVASQGENRQGAGIREGADQRYFTVLSLFLHARAKHKRGPRIPIKFIKMLHALGSHE